MPRPHLHISVTFLQSTCHARLGKEDAAPNEWPPSPLRLFQAMVVGAAARWAEGSSELAAPAPVAAFEWFERLCAAVPPVIYSPPVITGAPVPRYVRNNSADLLAAKWARGDALATFKDRTRKVFRPTLMQGGTTVHYVWPLDAAHERDVTSHLATLTAAARSIVALGWGVDVAIGDAGIIDGDSPPANNSASEPFERWQPLARNSGAIPLRLPGAGTFDELRRRHAAFLGRLRDGVFHPVPSLRTFTTSVYGKRGEETSRPFASFLLRPVIDPAIAEQDTPEGAAERRKAERFHTFRAANAAKVAAMLRHAACSAAKEAGGWPFTEIGSDRYVAGHGVGGGRRTADDESPRFSYLTIPSIGGPHADGMIRRVIVAEPFGGDGEHAAWAQRALAGMPLVDEDTGRPVATLEWADRSDAVERRMLDRFVGRSREWITMTPIVLPGFDGLKMEKAARLFSRACDQAGLPVGSVERFEFIGPPARGEGRFFVPNYLCGLPLRWAEVRFKHEIRGPLAIGAGRHCGLGIFAVESLA